MRKLNPVILTLVPVLLAGCGGGGSGGGSPSPWGNPTISADAGPNFASENWRGTVVDPANPNTPYTGRAQLRYESNSTVFLTVYNGPSDENIILNTRQGYISAPADRDPSHGDLDIIVGIPGGAAVAEWKGVLTALPGKNGTPYTIEGDITTIDAQGKRGLVHLSLTHN